VAQARHRARSRRGRAVLILRALLALLLLGWASCGFWHSAKPLPAGLHVNSPFKRMGEADVEFIGGRAALARRGLELIGRAEQLVVLDQAPLAREWAQAVLLRRRERPLLKIVVLTDPAARGEAGWAARDLRTLEAAGVVVVRVPLERLRDSNPLYAGLWRLLIGSWSTPYEEGTQGDWRARLRGANFRADDRALLVADDGAGGWRTLLGAADAPSGLLLQGGLAAAAIESELQIAAWSVDDDRLPTAPPGSGSGVGAIEARYLTEGALHGALLDALGGARSGDRVRLSAAALSDWAVLRALRGAATRGAELEVLLRLNTEPNEVVARLLTEAGAAVRFTTAPLASMLAVQHRNNIDLIAVSAELSRPALGDFNLANGVEFMLPARAGAAQSGNAVFTALFAAARRAPPAPEAGFEYWRYRLLEVSGLAGY
jgi:hypothetical protein